MPTLAPDVRIDAVDGVAEATTAARCACANFAANLAALRVTRSPGVELLARIEPELEWVFGRDGTLTTRTPGGRWWAGCSVPLLAGRALLATLEADPLSSCLLSPGHVGMVLAARERMGAGPALFVIEPNIEAGRVILGCHDFSSDILSHRLWFVCGPEWAGQLRGLFDEYRGLATPARFIRTKLTPPEIADGLIADAQAVFSAVLEDRAKIIGELQSADVVVNDAAKILQVGGSRFRLWDDGAEVLQRELAGQDVLRFDMDDPLSTSPIALIEAARECASVVSADVCRADSTNGVPMELPWITWMTRAAAPPFSTAGRRDALILADAGWRGIARAAGWPAERVRVCGWPRRAGASRPGTAPETGPKTGPGRDGPALLGIICDTRHIKIPKSIDEFSSHRVLWEMIEAELHSSPLMVDDADEYLRDRAGQLHIDTLDRPRFVRELILPAYQQGLARLLLAAGLPIRAWGSGWSDIPEFTAISHGLLTDRDAFETAVAGCSALVYCWPTRAAHPIDTIGKSVLHRVGRESAMLVRNARRLLAAPASVSGAAQSNLLGKTIVELLSIQPGKFTLNPTATWRAVTPG